MNWRSYEDLCRLLRESSDRIPARLDLIVGVPRSGMLPAALVSLERNLPLVDLDGFLEGRAFHAGRRGAAHERGIDHRRSGSRVLVLDDSVASGREMARVRELVARAGVEAEIVYGAVYVAPESPGVADFHLETCELPRMFSWNFMHHSHLDRACMDIDGVLCADPTEEQNDDGARYETFLRDAPARQIPTCPVGALITSRLEKYRQPTREWLAAHGVAYRELVMLDLPDQASRKALGAHAAFKADSYRERSWADIFIESSPEQAQVIASRARKPVICTATHTLHLPGLRALTTSTARKIPTVLRRRLTRLLMRWNRY